MTHDGTKDQPQHRRDALDPVAPADCGTEKKPLVRPVLVRHGSLPAVTGSFIGSFSA